MNKQTQNKTNNKKLFVDLSVVRLCLLVSLLSKSLRLLDGEQELLSELFQASVGRQIQTIEAEEEETELHLSVDLQMELQGDIYLFFKRSQAAHSSNRGSEIRIFIFPPVGTVLNPTCPVVLIHFRSCVFLAEITFAAEILSESTSLNFNCLFLSPLKREFPSKCSRSVTTKIQASSPDTNPGGEGDRGAVLRW